MRGQAGSVSEISVFSTKISVSGLEILPCEHFSPVNGMKAGALAVRMASSCVVCCIFHIISIPFNCSDAALRVTKAMIGAKVKIFVIHHVWALCFLNLEYELVPRIFGLFSSWKPGWNFSYEPQVKFIPVTAGQPGQPGSYEEALTKS